VRLAEADAIELTVRGDAAGGMPGDESSNLAVKAGRALAESCGESGRGARIELEKRIPAGMGLGGGSSDAAAVLRGLNRLWRLDLGDERLCEIAATVGSDVPFFIIGGSALITGRGERVEALPDASEMPLLVFLTDVELEDKTRRMYARITPDDYRSGGTAAALASSIKEGRPVSARGFLNAFDRHVGQMAEGVGEAMSLCMEAGLRVLACGSGPAFFSPATLEEVPPLLASALHDRGIRTVACRTMSRAEATRIREV
jgi:4-diphosphocytidyl-2-C-methyl-D-erythritol kinase